MLVSFWVEFGIKVFDAWVRFSIKNDPLWVHHGLEILVGVVVAHFSHVVAANDLFKMSLWLLVPSTLSALQHYKLSSSSLEMGTCEFLGAFFLTTDSGNSFTVTMAPMLLVLQVDFLVENVNWLLHAQIRIRFCVVCFDCFVHHCFDALGHLK